MIGFRLSPFPCPNCDHEILVDAMRSDDPLGDCPTFAVTTTFDHTGANAPDRSYERGYAGISRRELIREIRGLYKENSRLRAPFWSRWGWRR